jgi:hypothetical protein
VTQLHVGGRLWPKDSHGLPLSMLLCCQSPPPAMLAANARFTLRYWLRVRRVLYQLGTRPDSYMLGLLWNRQPSIPTDVGGGLFANFCEWCDHQ